MYYVEGNNHEQQDAKEVNSTAFVARHGAGEFELSHPIPETDMWRSSLGSRCVCKTATKFDGDIGVDRLRDRVMFILSMMGGAGIRGGF